MHPSRPRSSSQRGISLIIAMLMLVIIGIMSVTVMRSVTSTDQVTTGNRVQTQANQSAQMALRYCEDQLTASAGTRVIVVYPPTTPAAWTLKPNWTFGGSKMAYTLKPGDIQGGAANFPPVAPQCLAEVSTTNPSLYTVTARGFSPDFRQDSSTYATISGSVIWLQSTVYQP